MDNSHSANLDPAHQHYSDTLPDFERPFMHIIEQAIETARIEQRSSALMEMPVLEAYCELSDTTRFRAKNNLLEAARDYRIATDMRAMLDNAIKNHVSARSESLTALTEYTDLPNGVKNVVCGEFVAKDNGITVDMVRSGCIITDDVCGHPVLPIAYYTDISSDVGERRVRLAYRNGGGWQYVTVDRLQLCNSNDIIKLAAVGIDVITERAALLARYFARLENRNIGGLLPLLPSVSRLGFFDHDGKIYCAPYMEGIEYSGKADFNALYAAIHPQGDEDKWRDCVRGLRKRGGAYRLALAAAFAAPIVGYAQAQSFVVHLWGHSGAGKTLAQQVAASVWGDPATGKLIRTMNSTPVGIERLAQFMHNLPVFLNELQTAQGRSQSEFDTIIYMLGEGQGKTRGSADDGFRTQATWATVTITNGEEPIVSSASRAGAINRVVSCEVIDNVFTDDTDVQHILSVITNNYGHAGKPFVNALLQMPRQRICDAIDTAYEELRAITPGTDQATAKQLRAGAALLIADRIAGEIIFDDADDTWAASELVHCLAREDSVNEYERALEWLRGWIAGNSPRFEDDCPYVRYGVIRGARAYIIATELEKEMQNNGYNYAAFISEARRKGIIDVDNAGKNPRQSIGKTRPRCVSICIDVEQ